MNEELEQRVSERTLELQEANEEVKQFAYIISHDLRAPLVNLKGFAAELRFAVQEIQTSCAEILPRLDPEKAQSLTRAMNEDIPEALQFIDSSSSYMDDFIKAILKLSRLGHRELDFSDVDTRKIVDKMLEALSYQIDQKKVTVKLGTLPTIVADQVSMEQIIGNIVSNAIAYLDPDRPGEIEITSEYGTKETLFRIRDNGRGIAEQDMEKVFAPFRRAGPPDVPGEGMGLAYVQALVRRHGGRIWCESEPGIGTTFTFTISNQLAETT